MSSQVGPLKRLWYRWKMLRLPWRNEWLVGFDLAGNTFWEFKNALNPNRLRRRIRYTRQVHLGDVKIPPAWIQWLRYTRLEPPTIQEQQLDQIRQADIKKLAAAADARWAAKASFLDAPSQQQPVTGAHLLDPGGQMGQTGPEAKEGMRNLAGSHEEVQQAPSGRVSDGGRLKRASKESAWIAPKLGQSDLQKEPKSWTPSATGRR